jgi:hypothetical protein
MPNNDTYLYLEGGTWAESDVKHCACRGGGWMLSDYDTWHKCPIHYDGQRHPEQADWEAEMADEYPGGPPADDHEMCRKAAAKNDLPF